MQMNRSLGGGGRIEVSIMSFKNSEFVKRKSFWSRLSWEHEKLGDVASNGHAFGSSSKIYRRIGINRLFRIFERRENHFCFRYPPKLLLFTYTSLEQSLTLSHMSNVAGCASDAYECNHIIQSVICLGWFGCWVFRIFPFFSLGFLSEIVRNGDLTSSISSFLSLSSL